MPKTELVTLDKNEFLKEMLSTILLACEFGYRECERGHDLKKALFDVIEMFGKGESHVQ